MNTKLKKQKEKTLQRNTSKSHISLLTSHRSNGITLIALIITIIVLLILAVVAIQAVRGDGILAHAKNARDEYQKAQTDEEDMLDMLNNAITGQSLKETWKLSKDGKIVTKGELTLRIGDYVNYTPKPETSTYESSRLDENYTGSTRNNSTILTTESLKWRVLGVDASGCLTLISDQKTSTAIHFQGAKGYNNGVYILNDICKTLYSNSELGIIARSLTIEDIEAGFSKEGVKAREEYKNTESQTQYNHTKTYNTSSLRYPVIYAEENGSGIGVAQEQAETGRKTNGIGASEPFYTEKDELKTKPARQGEEPTTPSQESATASQNLTCTQTYYQLSKNQNYFKNETFCEMIFPLSGFYWLGTRDVDCDSVCARFDLRYVHDHDVSGNDMFYSSSRNDNGYNSGYEVRPVVSLGTGIEVILGDDASSNTDTTKMHQLRKAS